MWIGALIHVDWHLGRPGAHHTLSLDLGTHWLAGIIAFAPVAWLADRRWRASFVSASAFVIGVGVLLGQVVEPLSEVLLFGAATNPFTSARRWRVFAEFMVTGMASYALVTAGQRGVRMSWRGGDGGRTS